MVDKKKSAESNSQSKKTYRAYVEKDEFTPEQLKEWKKHNTNYNWAYAGKFVTVIAGFTIAVNLILNYGRSAPKNSPLLKEHKLIVAELDSLRKQYNDNTCYNLVFPASNDSTAKDLMGRIADADAVRKDGIQNLIEAYAQDSSEIVNNPEYQVLSKVDSDLFRWYNGKLIATGIVALLMLAGLDRINRKEDKLREKAHYVDRVLK
jgi:hypothetical protein